MDWQEDLETYPEHFQKIVKAQFAGDPALEAPAPVELIPSGIRPIPAEKRIKEFLEEITPKEKPTTFRFEKFTLMTGSWAVAIVVVVCLTKLLFGG